MLRQGKGDPRKGNVLHHHRLRPLGIGRKTVVNAYSLIQKIQIVTTRERKLYGQNVTAGTRPQCTLENAQYIAQNFVSFNALVQIVDPRFTGTSLMDYLKNGHRNA